MYILYIIYIYIHYILYTIYIQVVIIDPWHRKVRSHRSKMGVIYIYAICSHKTMCPPGYHYNVFMATHALGHMMYGGTISVHHVPKCMSCLKAIVVITGGTLFSWSHIILSGKIHPWPTYFIEVLSLSSFFINLPLIWKEGFEMYLSVNMLNGLCYFKFPN